VTSIGGRAFAICSSLTSITLPDRVTSIGDYAFESCVSLTTITMPKTATDIGEGAFYYCTELTSITIPTGVTKIEDYTFAYCIGMTEAEIIIPDGVVSIGDRAFSCCGLKSISIPDSVTTIGDYAFTECCTSVTIPDSVTKIGDVAFGFTSSGRLIDGFIISGYSGSAAETYAKEWDIPFVSLGNSTSTVNLSAGKISSLTNVAKGIKIKWSAVSNASGYYIYRKAGSGSYKKIKTITSASTISYTDKKVVDKNGKTYTYKVVPYSGSTEGTGSEKTTVRLTGTTLTNVKNSAASKAKVKWTAVTSVTGYQIQYSTSSSFASGKTKTVSGASKSSKTLTGLAKGSTYYVRIRTYKTVNGTKYYSAWSSKLKVTITK